MQKKRILENKNTKQIFNISIEENTVTYQTIKNGKGRIYTKELNSPEDALKFFYKKEWEVLKKGFSLHQKCEKVGEPKLHYFTSSGYTGCLSFANLPNGIFVYKNGWYEDEDNQTDFLDLLSHKGELQETIQLPTILPWDISYSDKMNYALLDLDHHIYKFDIETKKFEKIADREKGKWGSFIATSQHYYSYGTNEKITICDFESNIVFEKKIALEIINGDIAFTSALAEKSDIIAVHTKSGKVDLFNIKTGELIKQINGKFDFLDRVEFAENDKTLIIKPKFHKPLQYINIETSESVDYDIEIPEYSKDVEDFCLNSDQSKLAMLQRNTVYIFDFKAKKLITQFKIEYCVKSAKIRFINEDLGVRTDYGCFSLYKV